MKTQSRQKKTAATREVKPLRVENRHASRCAVCKSPEKEEIERRFLKFTTFTELAKQYEGLSYASLYRHMNYYGLEETRLKKTTSVYRAIIARGIRFILSDERLAARLTMDALKQLDKIEGTEQRPRENQSDRERKRQDFQDALDDLVNKAGLTEDEARSLIFERFPEAKDYLM